MRTSKPAGACTLTKRAGVVASVEERVLHTGRHEDEGARARDDLLAVDDEDELAVEHVEGIVLCIVRVHLRPFAPRLDGDDREVEARRVPGPREELDVSNAVSLPRPDDDRALQPH